MGKMETPHFVVSDALKNMLNAQRTALGSKVLFSTRDSEKLVTGIELPAFSLMWLCDSNILPFSKIVMFAGVPKSYKSALMFSLQSWFAKVSPTGGAATLIETEGAKYSVSMMQAMMGREIADNILQIIVAGTIEEGQEAITNVLKLYDDEKFRNLPLALGLDSLTGNVSEGRVEQIDKDGASKQDFPRAALLWTEFLKKVGSTLVGLPVTLFISNHLKDPIATPGRPGGGKTTPGGMQQRYASTLYFYITRGKERELNTYILDGKKIHREQQIKELEIECKWSSWGENGRKIPVELVWYYDENDQQVAYFDWEHSTVKVLIELQDKRKSSNPKIKISDICDVSACASSNMVLYDSDRMKMKGVMGHELGAAIHADKGVMQELQELLHIKRHNVWNGKMPEPGKLKEVELPEASACKSAPSCESSVIASVGESVKAVKDERAIQPEAPKVDPLAILWKASSSKVEE